MRAASRFSIRDFSDADIPEAVRFFENVYAPGHIMTVPEHLRWQFTDHPQAEGDHRSLILTDGSRIAGFLGIIPARTKVGERALSAGWCANLVASPDVRERGAGAFLLREAAKRFDLLITTGYNALSAPVLDALGWNLLPPLSRWVAVLRADCAGAPATMNPFPAAPSRFTIEPVGRFGASWDASWQGIRRRFVCTTERDAAYLNWRLIDHPRIRYAVLSASDVAGLRGYGALRMEDSPTLTGGRIVDLVAEDDAAPEILGALVGCAAEAGADFLDFFVSGDRYADALRNAGFVLADREPYRTVPAFLLPLDRRRSDITFAVWQKDGGINAGDWYVVKSDGDKDRAPEIL